VAVKRKATGAAPVWSGSEKRPMATLADGAQSVDGVNVNPLVAVIRPLSAR